MEKLGFFEKRFLPDYKNTSQIRWGELDIDEDKCSGCMLCVRACPAKSLHLDNKKARVNPVHGSLLDDPGINQCMSCGDCMAICPNGAIQIRSSYRWSRYFKTIGRGGLSLPRL
jgi:2-oxoglutarate ferredoxin oxidoreductase subunit delta